MNNSGRASRRSSDAPTPLVRPSVWHFGCNRRTKRRSLFLCCGEDSGEGAPGGEEAKGEGGYCNSWHLGVVQTEPSRGKHIILGDS